MNHFAITIADLIEDVKSSKRLLDAWTYGEDRNCWVLLPNTYLNYLSGVYIGTRNALVEAVLELDGNLTADQWADMADLGFALSPASFSSRSAA